MLMKEENAELEKFKEEITLKQLKRESHVIAQQQMHTQMQKELECELRRYRQIQADLNREKVEGDKKMYTVEAEIFLSKMAGEDLAHENEELRQKKLNVDKERIEAARRAKKQKRSTMRHVLAVGSVSLAAEDSRSCIVGGSVCVLGCLGSTSRRGGIL